MNINDYVEQYGDDSYLERPFNTADAFVFASLGFIRFEDINFIPSYLNPENKVFINEIPEEHIDSICDNELYGPGSKILLRLLKVKKRYKDISMQYLFDVHDVDLVEQLFAFTLNIPDVGYFIVFRGTDGTRVGWTENFNATINKVSAAQLDAVEYLNIVHNIIGDVPFMLGGHSKGGNLTFYASIFVEKNIQDLITKAYFFEGQGLPFKFYDKIEYKRIADRIVNVVPRDSIIGELFYTPKNPLVILADGIGVMQHDQFHWQVNGPDLYFIKERNPQTRALHRASKIWLTKGNKKEFSNLIKFLITLTYVEGKEDFISVQISFKKVRKRYKEVRKQFSFKERIAFYLFAFRMYKIYKNSKKYYIKKDKRKAGN